LRMKVLRGFKSDDIATVVMHVLFHGEPQVLNDGTSYVLKLEGTSEQSRHIEINVIDRGYLDASSLIYEIYSDNPAQDYAKAEITGLNSQNIKCAKKITGTTFPGDISDFEKSIAILASAIEKAYIEDKYNTITNSR